MQLWPSRTTKGLNSVLEFKATKPVPSKGITKMVKIHSLDPDRWGTIASTICAIHCAITGITVSVLSVIGASSFQSPMLEWGFLGFALIFGTWAAVRGFSIHRSWTPPLVFGIGFCLLLGSHFIGNRSGLTELFSVLGGIGLVSFHYVNRLHMKSCNH